MLPFLIAMLLSSPKDPSILTVPVAYAAELDSKAIWMEQLHKCENRDNVEKIFDVNRKYSYGKYMWQMSSWLSYDFLGATKENINDGQMQDKITRYALDHGKWRMWYTCAKETTRILGSY